MVQTSVVHLLLRRGPFTVAGLVIAVVILALKGQALRGLAHIRQKVAELVPAFTNFDAATSIIFPTEVIGVTAAA